MVGVCFKATNNPKKRNELTDFTNVLLNDSCRLRTIEESAIQKKYDKIERLELYFFIRIIFHSVVWIVKKFNYTNANESEYNELTFRLIFCIRTHIYYDYNIFFWIC